MRNASDGRPPEYAALDSLRGIAALAVVVFHVPWLNPVTALPFFQHGGLMVDFFFVLSGFVICHNYRQRIASAGAAGRFMWLRFARLYPVHLLFLLVFLGIEVLRVVMPSGDPLAKPPFSLNDGRQFVLHLLLLQDVGHAGHLSFNFPSWSISTEFWTYAQFALVVLLVGAGWRLLGASVAIVVAAAIALIATHHTHLASVTTGFGIIRCMLGFFLGVATCVVHGDGILRRRGPPIPTAAAAALAGWLAVAMMGFIVLFVSVEGDASWSLAVPPAAAVLIYLLVSAPGTPVVRALNARLLLWLGALSYSIYMSHAAVEWLVARLLLRVVGVPRIPLATEQQFVATGALGGCAALAVCLALVVAISWFTYTRIERPCNAFAKGARLPRVTRPVQA